MQRMYSCPNCQAAVAYGQRFCGNCGMRLNWPAQQTLPSQLDGGHDVNYQQQQQSQTAAPQRLTRGTQVPPSNQPQTRRMPNQDKPPKIFGNLSPIIERIGSSGVIIFLGALLLILFILGGIVIATNDAILSMFTSTAIKSFTAEPSEIIQGQTATLKWDVSGATSVSIDNGIGTVPSSGTQTVSPTETTTYTLTAANGASSKTKTATIIVSGPIITNFIAEPASITAGDSATLQWNVNGATSVSIDNSIGFVSSTNGTKTVSPTETTTYTLTATNSAGATTESATVMVTTNLPVITSFTAEPASITAGDPTTLQWNVSKATEATIDKGIGPVSSSGTQVVSPTETTTYKLTATNNTGSTTASATVTVTTGLPAITSFIADPATITADNSTALKWDIIGAKSASIDHNIGRVSSMGWIEVSPTETTTYTLTATNSIGSTTESVTVTVAHAPVINSFIKSHNFIIAGQSATLQWDVSGATSVSINNDIGPVPSSGEQTVSPTETTTYTLTATNSIGSTTASTTVTVTAVNLPEINSFTAEPATIPAGQSATLQWDVSEANSVTIDNGIGTVSVTSGTKVVFPSETTTYTLTATNSAGSVTASATVTLQ